MAVKTSTRPPAMPPPPFFFPAPSNSKKRRSRDSGYPSPLFPLLFGKKLTWQARLRRWLGRQLVRGLKWTFKASWTYRRTLAPFYLVGTLAGAGTILHRTPDGVRTAAVFAALSPLAVILWRRSRARRNAAPTGARLVFAWLVCLVSGVWLVTCAAYGLVPPVRGSLAVLGIAGAVAWWWHHRIKFGTVAVTTEMMMVWEEAVAHNQGALPGSDLTNIEDVPAPDGKGRLGVTAVIKLHPGRHTTDQAVSATSRIASAYGVAVTDVAVEPTKDGAANKARLTIYERNPLTEPREWPGPHLLDAEHGIAPIGVYPDGQLAWYRFWGESGPVHDLIAGTTGSGKSRLVDQLLAYERHSPLMASVVIDPQGGQSLPDWTDAVALFARSATDGEKALLAVLAVMYDRNRHLADVEWEDEKGRKRRGHKSFQPTPEMPLIVVTIEEAHAVLALQRARQAAEAIAKMGRKCGIKLRLVVQVPLLDQLGGSNTLRDMVAGGNVAVFRTANNLSGQLAFNGNLPADPKSIPREFPGGKTTAGMGYLLGVESRPTSFRAFLVSDPFDYASEGETTRLYEVEAYYLVLEHGGVDITGSDNTEDVQTTTVRNAAIAYLQKHGRATTGVIAQAIGAKLATVSQALKRAAKSGAVVKVGHGVWALPQQQKEAQAA